MPLQAEIVTGDLRVPDAAKPGVSPASTDARSAKLIKLILFDIDGTLLDADRIGSAALDSYQLLLSVGPQRS